MSKKGMAILGTTALTVLGGVLVFKCVCKRDPNDISRSIRRMSDKEISDIVGDMTEEELYEYTELIKDTEQRNRVYAIKELVNVLNELEKYEDS